VKSIHAESGTVFEPKPGGGYRCTHSEGGRPAGSGDGALIAAAFLVPFVGLIAGAIRLANRDSSGGTVLVIALVGNLLWAIVFFAMAGG
jgi:hypothetical protein